MINGAERSTVQLHVAPEASTLPEPSTATTAKMVVTAGVLVLLSEIGWSARRIDVGLWCAVGVAGLGLLGALKAMLTTPRVVLRRPPA